MFNVICHILITISASGVAMDVRKDVEGLILLENDYKYIVDFSEGVKKYNVIGKRSEYKKILVDKDQCAKE